MKTKMKYMILYLAMLLTNIQMFGQTPITIMTYNTSDDGSTWGGTESRLTNLYNVINTVSPDIIVAIEINNNNTGTFLSKCLASGYSKAAFIPNTSGFDQTNNGDDHNCNCLYYKTSKFSSVTHTTIPSYDAPYTAPTDTTSWRFRWFDRWNVTQTGGESMFIYAVHLKPNDWNGSSGGIYYHTGDNGVTDRTTEISYLLYDISNNLSSTDNYIVLGDFNTDNPSENAYINLLSDQGGYFHDPMNDPSTHLTGSWNSSYWDNALSWSSNSLQYRYDMMLVSSNVWNGSQGITYNGGTYKVDGNTNGSPPGSGSDLRKASDHLPVYATFYFNNTSTPVELVSFSGKFDGDSINLKWNTATEVRNYGFDIEKSLNNITWSKIGFVNGNGNSNSPHNYSFTDDNITSTGSFYYRLKQIDDDGSFVYSNVVSININTPGQYTLNQNYPNPFNPETNIKYSIPAGGFVSLKVFDILGREVAALVNENEGAGIYSVKFDGSKLPSGLYVYQLKVNNFISSRKLILMK